MFSRPGQRRAAAPRDTRRGHLADELRRTNIRDERVLAAMVEVDRALFVPPGQLAHAYDNTALPIGEGQTISQPTVVAATAEALRLDPGSRVLEIGAGCGYQAAVLSRLCAQVTSVERIPSLACRARENLRAAGIGNVEVVVGDASRGWPRGAPWDRIACAAAAPGTLEGLLVHLVPGGILVGPETDADAPPARDGRPVQVLRRRTLLPDGGQVIEDLFDVRFVPLVSGAASNPARPVDR